MAALLAAGGGFLLGILWMDLLFDVQIFGADPAGALASISAYYRRATIGAYPMNRLIAVVMLVTVAAAAYRVVRGRVRTSVAVAALGLAAVPVGLALFRIVPDAMRLGSGADTQAVQLELARAIAIGHLICLTAMLAFVALVIGSSRQ